MIVDQQEMSSDFRWAKIERSRLNTKSGYAVRTNLDSNQVCDTQFDQLFSLPYIRVQRQAIIGSKPDGGSSQDG